MEWVAGAGGTNSCDVGAGPEGPGAAAEIVTSGSLDASSIASPVYGT